MSISLQISKYCVLFFFLASLLSSCATDKTIINGLEERDAIEIIVFLDQKGIKANKVAAKTGGGGGGGGPQLWDITVPEEQANEAFAYLNAAGLPRRSGQNLLSIFSKGGLVPSALEEQIRHQAGLAEEISNTIRKIDGVLDARVMLSIPEEDPLAPPGTKKQSVSASVYVKHTGVLDDPNSHLVTKIRRLVASSVPGLDFDNVTVIPDRARFSSMPFIPGASLGEEEKDYVSIWKIIVAKESVSRFRAFFFAFFVAVITLLILFFWTLWKVMPLLHQAGGFMQLFTLHSLKIGNGSKESKKEKAQTEASAEAEAEAETEEEGHDVEEPEADEESEK